MLCFFGSGTARLAALHTLRALGCGGWVGCALVPGWVGDAVHLSVADAAYQANVPKNAITTEARQSEVPYPQREVRGDGPPKAGEIQQAVHGQDAQ